MSGCHNTEVVFTTALKENIKQQINDAIEKIQTNKIYSEGFMSGFVSGFDMAVNMMNEGKL